MDEPRATDATGSDPGWYRICVQGRLAQRWSTWFDGMSLSPGPDGTTVLRGPVGDQAALHGLLQKVGDLGLILLEVTQEDPGGSGRTSAAES
ncbi:MAG: hypothetical protein JWN68_902 [Nocardioides sp.]|jgi:hypothetical protein|uniref:hypothetical protein n=1 Tax=Nocardioides sp. TaxID=35761 RepID=UPI0026265F8D|nr:hypothetical protein [Nocardioides sp.]MCW2832949.1 hypothetical protein [Nocardioides sp.]